MDSNTEASMHRDVVVVGAGQAGLATGYWLQQAGINFEIVDSNSDVGQSWRNRFDSLTLFTSRAYCELPGMGFPGDLSGYPSKDEMADYLVAYADRFNFPIKLNSVVTKLSAVDSGYVLELNGGVQRIIAKQVVIATGSFQKPKVPLLAEDLNAELVQFTMATYRNPQSLPEGAVLVVGDGASGRQIALDISGHRRVILATGEKRNVTPQRILGRDIFWWLDKLGILWAGPQTWVGKMLRKRNPFPDKNLELKCLARKGVDIQTRLAGFEGRLARFSDGTSESIDAVVWTVGYRDDIDWVAVENVLNHKRQFKDVGLNAVVPGLYFVGRNWQRSRASALVCGVGRDAHYLVDSIIADMSFSSENAVPEKLSRLAGSVNPS